MRLGLQRNEVQLKMAPARMACARVSKIVFRFVGLEIKIWFSYLLGIPYKFQWHVSP
jgi:hypothetical protein